MRSLLSNYLVLRPPRNSIVHSFSKRQPNLLIWKNKNLSKLQLSHRNQQQPRLPHQLPKHRHRSKHLKLKRQYSLLWKQNSQINLKFLSPPRNFKVPSSNRRKQPINKMRNLCHKNLSIHSRSRVMLKVVHQSSQTQLQYRKHREPVGFARTQPQARKMLNLSPGQFLKNSIHLHL